MGYFKDAQGDWMTQPAGMVPSWRGWAQGPVGPSASYRMPPLTKMSGCGACGGLAADDETLPDYDVDTDTATLEPEGITPAEAAAQAKGGGMGTVLLLGLGAVALWMLFGGKARRNPCHRNSPPRGGPSRLARLKRSRAAKKAWNRRRARSR